MDFEQQLEKAEKLSEPSLVGASLRSADDSAHNNYIHPEKYKSKKPSKPKKGSKKSIAASLDDLISEGALLGSEEDFEKFLDDEGHVKDNAKYTQQAKPELDEQALKEKESSEQVLATKDAVPESPLKYESHAADPVVEAKPSLDPNPLKSKASAFYKQEDYSTPNLSEYQLEHQIKDHHDLLSSIQSYDPHKLPKSVDGLSINDSKQAEKSASSVSSKSVDRDASEPAATTLSTSDSIHTPYFHTERARSRSRSANPSRKDERSRSRSAVKPHLARGDSYKNTHVDEPSKYELPADLARATDFNEEEEEDDGDRRTRQSKPTMGESIAKAEAEAVASGQYKEKAFKLDESFARDTSLVTTGDYTNFNVDNPSNEFKASDRLYATRSESSTNYLRSISRSRSRARPIDHSHENEKNDANPEELVREGALVTDDPYTTIDHLDTMVEEVLHPRSEELKKSTSEQKKNVNFETREPIKLNDKEDASSSEKKSKAVKEDKKDDSDTNAELNEIEIPKEAVPEDKSEGSGPTITAADIKVKSEDLPEEEDVVLNEPEIEEVKKEDITDLAAEKIKESEVEPTKEVKGSEAATAAATAATASDDFDDLDVSPEELRKHLESQPIYLYTSLAGGMQIVPRTNRLVTILQANGIKFEYRDLGTDEEAKKIWRRQAAGKPLPGIVRGDDFIGNFKDIDEANEEYKLRELLYETL
ncbi:uncharacterized protein CANTADRAFT_43715 [Suhomyces tanzawaensis NRRL Y-17324]|uniref:Uncharacterized protein n=1 Tax=Suhomyces tanzawaensis NRRL Y-17324 TaxID=984487 RepID=A0A1E4SQS6_9ASCO|nr:uncharacterized protein CANTADRAFT_43715 [Suhomyces tanzawaensis NRRL Y-17324]ODV81797.1 hypothetical protein CANTADRAFT_43715 [Suhomyces tanzawaensis NRRL Y-17324]